MSITNILIPGRHHVLTNFQHDYLSQLIADPTSVRDTGGKAVNLGSELKFIWAVTSANHAGTRRNPLPGHRREAAIEKFALGAPSYVFPIDNVGESPRFADHTIKEIEVLSRGQFRLTPKNTVVAVSTPAVIDLYEKLGFVILPMELSSRETGASSAPRAWDIVLAIAAAGAEWRADKTYLELVHPASKDILERYRLGDLIVDVHNDPLLSDEGDITEHRDYATYRQAFDEGAERKYGPMSGYIKPGRIVDVGSATGSIIKLMSDDPALADADLYGIEVARPLYEICRQRKANEEFGNENTFFYQRNIMTGKLFPDNTVNTTTTFALTHEIDSYIGRDGLNKFITQVYDQTAPGGVWINSDVVGPEGGEKIVWLWLATTDGQNETDEQKSANSPASGGYLANLPTAARFKRFTQDFRADEGDGFTAEIALREGKTYALLRLADAVEFMVTKDYTQSWYSEMHERFCYWSIDDWRQAVTAAGFTVHPDSAATRNDWIVHNRWAGHVALLRETGGKLEPMEFPVTNMLLIAEKK